jgi:hypothetical protein
MQAKKNPLILKLDYSMTKVYDGHTNKEFNKNYEKFQEAAIFFWNGNIKTIIS